MATKTRCGGWLGVVATMVALDLTTLTASAMAQVPPRPAPNPAPAPAAAPAPAPAATPGGVSFPGGALSLTESHGDWLLSCAVIEAQNRKSCVVTQEQTDQKSRQRVLSVQVQPNGASVEGVAVLPFGLQLDSVALRFDPVEGTPTPPAATLKFRTCLPAGCLVPLGLDAKLWAALRAAKVMVLTARVADSAKEISFTISAKGLAPAYDRATALMR